MAAQLHAQTTGAGPTLAWQREASDSVALSEMRTKMEERLHNKYRIEATLEQAMAIHREVHGRITTSNNNGPSVRARSNVKDLYDLYKRSQPLIRVPLACTGSWPAHWHRQPERFSLQ